MNAKDSDSSRRLDASQDTLIWALTAVTIVGIGSVMGLMAIMKEVVHFHDGLIIAFSLLVFLTFLGVDSVIVWLLLRPKRNAREEFIRAQQKELTTNELEIAARALPEPSFSVTDHTTNILEPAERIRRSE